MHSDRPGGEVIACGEKPDSCPWCFHFCRANDRLSPPCLLLLEGLITRNSISRGCLAKITIPRVPQLPKRLSFPPLQLMTSSAHLLHVPAAGSSNDMPEKNAFLGSELRGLASPPVWKVPHLQKLVLKSVEAASRLSAGAVGVRTFVPGL